MTTTTGRVLDASDFRHGGNYRGTGSAKYATPAWKLRPASEKQVALIIKLATERQGLPGVHADLTDAAKVSSLNGGTASTLIDSLVKIRVAKCAQTGSKAEVAVTEVGLYEVDEHTVAEVVKSQNARLYAKKYDLANGESVYTPGLIFALKPEQKISLERAQELGRINGRCVRCRRTLTQPKSVAAGIGPVCSRYSAWA